MSGGDSSLNTKINADGESDAEWQDWLEDEAADHVEKFESKEELDLRRVLLVKAMSDLTEREKEIISSRQLSDEPKTLEELSRVFKVSRERVRQIEVKAFEKLREKINILNKEKLKV